MIISVGQCTAYSPYSVCISRIFLSWPICSRLYCLPSSFEVLYFTIMRYSQLIGLSAIGYNAVSAFPAMSQDQMSKLTSEASDLPRVLQEKRAKRSTTVPFDAATQHTETTGTHAWVAPNFAAGDQRGPCPGNSHSFLWKQSRSDFFFQAWTPLQTTATCPTMVSLTSQPLLVQ